MGSNEVLLCAGDVTDFPTREENLRRVRETCTKMVYVLGNHEYYGAPSPDIVLPAYRRTCADLDISLLENQAWEGDAVVFGCTLWTYPHARDWKETNDRRFLPLERIRAMHQESKDAIKDFLQTYSSPKPLVVMTHHMPSTELLQAQYYFMGSSMFASHCDNFIRPPVCTWVYGHTHSPDDRTMNGVRVVCNPRGYPGERPGTYAPIPIFTAPPSGHPPPDCATQPRAKAATDQTMDG